MQLLGICQLMPMHGLIRVALMELLHFNGDCLLCGLTPLLAAFMDSCTMIIPTMSACLCRPFSISLTDLCAMHMASLLPRNNDVIWVKTTTSYLLPFILGTYFSSAFLTRVFQAAILILGCASFLTGFLAFAGLLVFFGLVAGSAFGAIGVL